MVVAHNEVFRPEVKYVFNVRINDNRWKWLRFGRQKVIDIFQLFKKDMSVRDCVDQFFGLVVGYLGEHERKSGVLNQIKHQPYWAVRTPLVVVKRQFAGIREHGHMNPAVTGRYHYLLNFTFPTSEVLWNPG